VGVATEEDVEEEQMTDGVDEMYPLGDSVQTEEK
jgi:hypothetical protein